MQLYLALRYWSAPTSFIALVTLYGYSLVIYLPIAVRRVSRVAPACELTRRVDWHRFSAWCLWMLCDGPSCSQAGASPACAWCSTYGG